MLRMKEFGSALLLSAVLIAGTSVLVAESAPSGTDPVIEDVQRMLDAGVDSAVVLTWLSDREGPGRPPNPDELIRLKKAGASDELLQKLLDMASKPAPPPPAPPPAPAAAASPPGAPDDGKAGLAVSFRYRSQSDSDEETGRRWAMFAYLDGELLTWSRSGRNTIPASLRIEPGKHVIRLLRESHVRKNKKWRHEAHVCPEPIEFEVEAGEGWSLSVEWVVPTFAFNNKGPLSWELQRWDRAVAGASRIGEREPGNWPQLCEDMEANIPPDKEKVPGWIRRELQGCVRWDDLWQDGGAWPERAVVRDRLQEDEFRPSRDEYTASSASTESETDTE